MKQKKLVISVLNENGDVVFSKDPASVEHVHAAIALYAEICSKIVLDFPSIEIPAPTPNNN